MGSEISQRIRAGFVRPEEPPTTPIEQQRREWEDFAAQTPLPPVISVEAMMFQDVPGVRVTGPDSRTDLLLILVHGGGFNSGSSVTHRALAGQIAVEARATVLLPDYRRAPEDPFPTARDDIVTTYRWALRHGQEPAKIVLLGDSAGAHIAVTAVLALRDLAEPLPTAVVLLSPWLDLTLSGESMQTRAQSELLVLPAELVLCADHYRGQRAADDLALAPLHTSLHDFPPALIQAGDDEILLSDAVRMADRLRAADRPVDLQVWPGMWHVWHGWAPELPEANAALAAIGAFVRRHMKIEREKA